MNLIFLCCLLTIPILKTNNIELIESQVVVADTCITVDWQSCDSVWQEVAEQGGYISWKAAAAGRRNQKGRSITEGWRYLLGSSSRREISTRVYQRLKEGDINWGAAAEEKSRYISWAEAAAREQQQKQVGNIRCWAAAAGRRYQQGSSSSQENKSAGKQQQKVGYISLGAPAAATLRQYQLGRNSSRKVISDG